MNIAGIICEYNPFHNGHQLHIAKTRETTSCDGIVAVMSGNFVQRGEPAIFDKRLRARIAIAGGADLVLELPAMFAAQSAEFFAKHAVTMLNATGVVKYLSFGAECADLTLLKQIAEIYAEEPPQYRTVLKDALAAGKSFPKARGLALAKCIGSDAANTAMQPNNLLAIEYLKALKRTRGPEPVAVLREIAEHDGMTAHEQFASAALIRHTLCGTKPQTAKQFLPPHTWAELQGHTPKRLEDYTQAILIQLCKYSLEELRELPAVAEGLECKIYRAARESNSLPELLENIKSARYPLSRLRRILLHALLGINKNDLLKKPLYLKILDFNETGQRILHEMKQKAKLPIVKHTGHARRTGDKAIMELWERELLFDKIYEL